MLKLDTLYNKDCIEGMAQIDEGSIDLAFADPPFNIGYKYDVYEDRMAADEYLDWTQAVGQAHWSAPSSRTARSGWPSATISRRN